MRTTIRKWFWAWQYEEEDKWLNDMAAQGKALVSARYLTYEFEDSEPGEYAIRLEMLENMPDSEEGKQYIAFVEETGAEYVGKVMKWVYFRKKRTLGAFELHGDNSTRIKHLKGIIALLLPLGAVNLGVGIYNIVLGVQIGSPINVVCGCVSGVLTGLIVGGLIKLNDKKQKLEKESQLFE